MRLVEIIPNLLIANPDNLFLIKVRPGVIEYCSYNAHVGVRNTRIDTTNTMALLDIISERLPANFYRLEHQTTNHHYTIYVNLLGIDDIYLTAPDKQLNILNINMRVPSITVNCNINPAATLAAMLTKISNMQLTRVLEEQFNKE